MHNYILDRVYKDEIRFSGNREKALIRDNYSCQICGSKEMLDVHHKDKSGQTDHPNNELDNLITLCKSCHMKQHKGDNMTGRYSECLYCGKEIYIPKSGRNKYCSKECCDKAKIGVLKTGEIRNCLVCGKEFKALRANIELGKAKYCSHECSARAQRKRVIMTCLTCGKEFEEIPARVKDGKGKYCSKQCYSIAQSKK